MAPESIVAMRAKITAIVTAAAGSAGSAAVLFWLVRCLRRRMRLPPPGPRHSSQDGPVAGRWSKEQQVELAARYGPIFRVWCPARRKYVIAVSDPDIMYKISMDAGNMYRDPCKYGRAPYYAKLVSDVFGPSVTGMIGDGWKWRKEAILRQFVNARLLVPEMCLLEAMVSEGERMCATLGKAADEGKTICVGEVTMHSATAVVLHLMYGRRPEFDENAMRKSSKGLIQVLGGVLNPLLTEAGRQKLDEKKRECHEVFDVVARKELEQILRDVKTGSRSPDRKPCLMEALIRSEPRFLEGGMDGLLADARVLVNAGYETTGHALAFAFGMLAEPANAAVAEKAREAAANAVAGGLGREGLWDRTAYLDQVFHEALRLFPISIKSGSSVAYSDFEVEFGAKSYLVPKGSSLQWHKWAGQRCERVWPQPDRCNPEHWSGHASSDKRLMAFSLGAHQCPGKNLSHLEARVFLTMVLSKFRFELPPGVDKVDGCEEVLLTPKDGMPLRVFRVGHGSHAYEGA